MKPSLAAAVGLAAVALCSGAWAADKGKPAENAFNLQPIALPVLSKGVLVNYVFITLKLVLSPAQDATRLHEREPFLRDSLVRMAVHTPFNGPGNLAHLDDPRLKATVMGLCRNLYGPGAVTAVQIVNEAPQRRTGLAGGAEEPLD